MGGGKELRRAAVAGDWKQGRMDYQPRGGKNRPGNLPDEGSWEKLLEQQAHGSASLPSSDLGIPAEGYIVFQRLNWFQCLTVRKPVI